MEGKCCKCEEHCWTDFQTPVYRDERGDCYCVWHAPKGHKGISDDKFALLAIKRLQSAISRRNSGHPATWCDFSGVVFPGPIAFHDEQHFKSIPGVVFEQAYFWGSVEFVGMRIEGEANFSNATFRGNARFISVIFSEEAYFYVDEFDGKVDFGSSSFLKDVHFSRSIFGKTLDFSCTTIKERAYFNNVIFCDKALFLRCIGIPRTIIFSSFDKNSIENLYYSPVELPQFSFSCCHWPDRLYHDTHKITHSNYSSCEELYRAMKQRAAEEHDQPQVSRWHFREKLMQLKQLFNNERSNDLIEVVEDRDAKWGDRTKAWFKLLWHGPHWPKLSLTGIYWATSGFGERAVRAGVWLLALVALSFLANSIMEPWVWAELPGSAAAGYTMATIPFAKDIPGDGWVKVGRGFWQLLIAVQFTLFALAVRNRFRR